MVEGRKTACIRGSHFKPMIIIRKKVKRYCSQAFFSGGLRLLTTEKSRQKLSFWIFIEFLRLKKLSFGQNFIEFLKKIIEFSPIWCTVVSAVVQLCTNRFGLPKM